MFLQFHIVFFNSRFECPAFPTPPSRSSPQISKLIRHYGLLPECLTRILVDAMADVKKAYLEAIENGALCTTDAHTAETFARLQLEVSTIRQASLLSSLSHYAMLCDVLNGRTFTILRCIHELNMITEQILKESQLCQIASHRFATQTAPSPTSVIGF
ncbi:hypothetical protein B0H14DRAFT_3445431 [Mycena olivaceomarginata]|nr:hypothetical protein B0H14DRAFT_3445431 [Mycena olivaceomarginata]